MHLRLLFSVFGLLFFLFAQAELPELIPVRVGDRFGYCDGLMEIKIPAMYQEAMPFEKDRAIVKQGDRFGLIDRAGNWILAPELDEIITGQLLRLRKNGKYALSDWDGCQLTEYSLTAIYELKNRYFLLDEQGRKGLANPEGKVLVPCLFEQVSQLRDDQSNYMDLFAVRKDGKLGLYNACGEACLPPMLQSIGIFQEGFAVVQQGRQFGMIEGRGSSGFHVNLSNCRE